MLSTSPERIAIVAMGASSAAYYSLASSAGGPDALWDEVWAISSLGGTIAHDRAFVMDDLLVTEAEAEAAMREGGERAKVHRHVGPMGEWMRKHPGPLYTARAYPDEFPGAVAYPLRDVIKSVGFAYFNTSVAYAIGLAIHLGVKRIGLYGCDFTYPDNHAAEKGRACAEFLLCVAMHRGIGIGIPAGTTLFDGDVPLAKRFYGYAEAPDLGEVRNGGSFEHELLAGSEIQKGDV